LLAAELALLALAAVALGARGWGFAAILAGGPLAVRLAIACASFAIAWICRTPRAPEHRLGVAGTLRLILSECRALVAYNLLYLPWEKALVRPDPPLAPGDRPAIVLAHGYLANRGCFAPLIRNLEAARVGPIFAPNLRSWL